MLTIPIIFGHSHCFPILPHSKDSDYGNNSNNIEEQWIKEIPESQTKLNKIWTIDDFFGEAMRFRRYNGNENEIPNQNTHIHHAQHTKKNDSKPNDRNYFQNYILPKRSKMNSDLFKCSTLTEWNSFSILYNVMSRTNGGKCCVLYTMYTV